MAEADIAPLTEETIVRQIIDDLSPLFDDSSKLILWGTLSKTLGRNGIALLHAISGLSEEKLKDYEDMLFRNATYPPNPEGRKTGR